MINRYDLQLLPTIQKIVSIICGSDDGAIDTQKIEWLKMRLETWEELSHKKNYDNLVKQLLIEALRMYEIFDANVKMWEGRLSKIDNKNIRN